MASSSSSFLSASVATTLAPSSSSLLPLGFAVAPDAPVSSAPLLPSFSLGSASLVAPTLPFAAQSLSSSSLLPPSLSAAGVPPGFGAVAIHGVPHLPLPRLASSFSLFLLLGPSLLLLSLVLRSRWMLPLLPVLPILQLWVRSLRWLLLCLTLFMLRSAACMCTLFADFFVAPPDSTHLPVFLDWFPRVCPSLSDADNRLASLLASGRPASSTLPQRLSHYAVHGEVFPWFLSGACRLAIVGLRCLGVPRSCGIHVFTARSTVSGRDCVFLSPRSYRSLSLLWLGLGS